MKKKKIYALFSSQMGEGSKCTFITSLKDKDEVKGIKSHIGNALFMIGECEVGEDEYTDADTRTWWLSEFDTTVECTIWPFFQHK